MIRFGIDLGLAGSASLTVLPHLHHPSAFAAKDDAKLHSVFAHTRRVTGKTSLTVDTAIDADAKYGYFGGRPAPEHKNSTTGTPAFGR